MNAAILTKLNAPLTLENVEPGELKFGQVLVKIIKSGLCGAQLQEIKGLKGNGKFLPHLLGHEGCGVVAEVGPQVTTVKKGDKVVLHWRKGVGIEADFPQYKRNGMDMSSGKITTLSELAIISENRLTRVPDDTNDDLCALLGCGLSTGLSVINKEANLKFGESVLILGAGGVGLNCVLASKLSCASPIVAVDLNKQKSGMVKSNGGEFFHTDSLSELFKRHPAFDCIIDTTGHLELVSQCLPHLSEQGRCILVAQPKVNDSLHIVNPINLFSSQGLCIKTTQAGGFNPDVDIPRYIKLYFNNNLDLGNIITDFYPLEEINGAITKLLSGTAGRIMINIGTS